MTTTSSGAASASLSRLLLRLSLLLLSASLVLFLPFGCFAKASDAANTGRDSRRAVKVARSRDRNDVVHIARDASLDDESLRRLLHRSKRQANTQNQMELLIVLDARAFAGFVERTGSDAAATTEVQRVMAGQVVAANRRLAKMDTGGFSVRAILTEIVILAPGESTVTDDLDTNNDGIINADLTLERFVVVSTTFNSIKPHDYSLLITGYDLQRGNGADTIGITFQSGVCSDQKQGVMEDDFSGEFAGTMAHEMGHSMSAVHDQSSNSCPDVNNVMSATASTPTSRATAPNPFSFSSCSGTETSPGSEVDLVALTEVPLGQQFKADAQCANTIGTGAVFCRSQYNNPGVFDFNDMCYSLRCKLPNQAFCTSILALYGTGCDNQKWCDEGLCVSAASAPATVSATCPQGDDPTANCSPSSCLVEQLRTFQCCQTCSLNPLTTTPGVPATLSIAGVTPAVNTTPGGAATMSVFGVVPGSTTPRPGPNPATMSVFGVQPGTTLRPGPVTMSVFGVQPNTDKPTPGGATMSIFGVQPGTATPATPPGGATMSVFGVQPGTATPPVTPGGATMSIFGVQPGTATPPVTPGGATLSIFGVQPGTATPPVTPGGATLSIFGVQPGTGTTPMPGGPTLSVNGVTGGGPTAAPLGISVAGAGGVPTPAGPTLSIAGTQGPTVATLPGISVAGTGTAVPVVPTAASPTLSVPAPNVVGQESA